MRDNTPRISVGMPVYNGERYIKETLDSILSQTFDDFELIISDNASTDGTAQICREYIIREPRVRYFRNEKNLGAAWNYNKVFNLSTGKYFKWAPADDVCAPEFLERCIDILDHYPGVVLCYPRTTLIDEKSEVIGEYLNELHLQSDKPHERFKRFQERFYTHNHCYPLLGLIRNSSLKKTRLIGTFRSSDEILLGELILLGKIFEVPENLYFKRDHPQTSVRAYSKRERAIWFDPKNTGIIHEFLEVRLYSEHNKSIKLARMTRYERAHCHLQMVKRFWRHRSMWMRESIRFGYWIAQKLPRPIFITLRFIFNSLSWLIESIRRVFSISASSISKILSTPKT